MYPKLFSNFILMKLSIFDLDFELRQQTLYYFIIFCTSYLISIILMGCTKIPDPFDETGVGVTEIWIEDSHSIPFHKYVEPGAVVTWINKDTIPHGVSSGTPDDAGRWFQSDTINPGERFSKKFIEPETYAYHCTIHGYHSDQLPVLIVTEPVQPTPSGIH